MTPQSTPRNPGNATAEPPGDLWDPKDGQGRWKSGWALLPLRLFLGITFLFAGLQKLANPAFFRSSSPISIHAQLAGAAHTSPIGGLLNHLTSAAVVIGVIIALGEVAIGIGALLGFLTRIAAVGGVLVSLSLFLAVSFHTHPYYSGSDIVFLFAWIPFVMAGSAGGPAVDTWLAMRPGPAGEPATSSGVTRRQALSTGALTALVAGGTVVLAGVVTGLGRAFGGSSGSDATGTTTTTGVPTPSSTTTSTVPSSTTTSTGVPSSTTTPTTTPPTTTVPTGTNIGPSASVPVGGSATFNVPKSGDPGLVIQEPSGTFTAFDAICPHAGCTVAYQPSAKVIVCPCHGSEFNAKTGAVLMGPATSGLTPVKVVRGANGDLYAV